MKDVLDIHRALLGYESRHEIIRLPRMISTADELPEALGLPRHQCLAVRVYTTPRGLVAALVQTGESPPPLAVVSAAGVRDARPAPPDIVNRVTDYAADLVAPVLLPGHLPLLVDRSILPAANTAKIVYTATGDSGTALGIDIHELLRISGAVPTDLATRRMELPVVPGAVWPAPRAVRTSQTGRPASVTGTEPQRPHG